MNMEEDSESAQVTIQPVSFVLSPSTQSRKLKDMTEMHSSVDLALRTQPSQQLRSAEKYYPLPPKPASRNENLKPRGVSTQRESFTTKSESINNRDMSRTSQNFIESVARYSNQQREGPETIKEESRDSGSIQDDRPPSRNRSRDIFEINLKEISSEYGNSSAQQSESARRQLRFSSIKQDSPPRGKLPEVPPFKIDMHSRQTYSNFNYDEQGMVSVRGEDNLQQPTIRGGTQEMENSGNFKTLSSSRSEAHIARIPLMHTTKENQDQFQRLPAPVVQFIHSLQAKNSRLEDRVENLAKVNEATIMQLRPILNKNQDLEKENQELRILVQTQEQRYQEVRMELHNVKQRLKECEHISGERSESIKRKYNSEREKRAILERENEALKRDKEELIQEINKSTNNTNHIVGKLEQEYRNYKEKMSEELIAKDNIVQDLRKQVGGRPESQEKWVLERKESSSSGQTTARNSRRPSAQNMRKRNESSVSERVQNQKLLAEENYRLREELNRHKEEIMRLKSKLARCSRSKLYIEKKQVETERSRSNAESYVEQAIMANQKLTKRIDHKNAKIQKLKRKIRNISNESGSRREDSYRGSDRGSTFRSQIATTVRQGHDQGIDLRGRNPSTNTTWRPNESEEQHQWRPHQSQEMMYILPGARKLTRESSAPQLLQATQVSSNIARPVQRRLHSRDISQSPRSLSIEKLQSERFLKERAQYLEVGHVSHIPNSSSYLENEAYGTNYREEGRMKDFYKYNNEYMSRQGGGGVQKQRNTNHLERSALTYMSRKYDTDIIAHEPSINTLSSLDFKEEIEHIGRNENTRRARLEAELNRLQQDYGKLMRYSKSLMENHKAKERTRRELNEMARAMQIKQNELNCM